jgi:hypothetical protein
MFPIRDNIPNIGFPPVTWGLIILNGIISSWSASAAGWCCSRPDDRRIGRPSEIGRKIIFPGYPSQGRFNLSSTWVLVKFGTKGGRDSLPSQGMVYPFENGKD